MDALECRNELVNRLSADSRILGIGQTGSLDTVLVPGKSDIDLFVLCTEIPPKEDRQAIYSNLSGEFDLHMSVCNGGLWGHGDILVCRGIDVMPMYFTLQEMDTYLREILSGLRLNKEGRFYPVGRLASISTIHILAEKERSWFTLKNMVNQKPLSFFRKWYESEISQVLDEEDLGRSELRKEVLFFHQVLENALDHLLQTLYAINRIYFPSRKRTLSDLESFDLKPVNCGPRLLRIVEKACCEESLTEAILDLRHLTAEIRQLGEQTLENRS